LFGFTQWLFLEENSRERNKFQDKSERIKYGKDIESKIVQALTNQYGWNIVPPSSNQDKFDKIDGTLISSSEALPVSLPAPIQIKYRDTGNDILMEVSWVFNGNFDMPLSNFLTGRDMKGKAKLYVSLDQSGKMIRVRLAEEAKKNAIELLENLIKNRSKVFSSELGQIRITRDPKDGRQKINAFINPDSFSWTKNYPVEDIWNSEIEKPKTLSSPASLLPKEISPQMVSHITKAIETGEAVFKMPNNAKKIKVLEKYASKRGLELTIQNDNVILRKVA
jgi:hypothetical protein